MESQEFESDLDVARAAVGDARAPAVVGDGDPAGDEEQGVDRRGSVGPPPCSAVHVMAGRSAIDPVPRSPLAVGHRVHLNGLVGHAEEDQEWESRNHMAAEWVPWQPQGRGLRGFEDVFEGGVDRSDELDTEAGSFRLIPQGGGGDLSLRLRSDGEAPRYDLARRARIRDRTSVHSGARSPRAAPARSRRSSSAIQAASQPASAGPSKLARTSVAIRTRSCSGRPRTSCRSCFADFDMDAAYQPCGGNGAPRKEYRRVRARRAWAPWSAWRRRAPPAATWPNPSRRAAARADPERAGRRRDVSSEQPNGQPSRTTCPPQPARVSWLTTRGPRPVRPEAAGSSPRNSTNLNAAPCTSPPACAVEFAPGISTLEQAVRRRGPVSTRRSGYPQSLSWRRTFDPRRLRRTIEGA